MLLFSKSLKARFHFGRHLLLARPPVRAQHSTQAHAQPRMAFPAEVEEAKVLICEMCRNFYNQGWVSGTGGGISMKVGDYIVMAPSGVQKERMQPEDMFILDAQGEVVHTPAAKPPPARPPKLSECSPLFMSVGGHCHSAACTYSFSLP